MKQREVQLRTSEISVYVESDIDYSARHGPPDMAKLSRPANNLCNLNLVGVAGTDHAGEALQGVTVVQFHRDSAFRDDAKA